MSGGKEVGGSPGDHLGALREGDAVPWASLERLQGSSVDLNFSRGPVRWEGVVLNGEG